MKFFKKFSKKSEFEEELEHYQNKAENKRFYSNPLDKDFNDNNQFELIIQDVFQITGRGIVVTGRVDVGTIQVNDNITINHINGSTTSTKILGIEVFRKKLEVAEVGDNVGLLLDVQNKKILSKGDVITRSL